MTAVFHTLHMKLGIQKKNIIGLRKARNFENYKELLPSCDIGLSTVIVKKNFYKKY